MEASDGGGLGGRVDDSVARARQVARALSQLPGVVWFQLDARSRVLAWSASAAAIVDPLGRIAAGPGGLGLDFLECLTDADSRAAWSALVDRREPAGANSPDPLERGRTLDLELGRGLAAVRLELVVRRTPSEFEAGASGAGLVLLGGLGREHPPGLALLDADLRGIVDLWPAAEAVVGDGGRAPSLPFPTEQRAGLRGALLRGQAARARLPWSEDAGGTRWLQLELVALRGDEGRADRALALVEEVEDARRATLDLRERERRLRRVVEATAAVTGRGFLRSLVKALSRALGVRVAYVAERLPGDSGRLRMLCLWSGRDFTSGYDYAVEGTLDGRVLEQGPQAFTSGLPAAPGPAMGIGHEDFESYSGIPIPDRDGRPTGVLGVMNDGPLDGDLPVAEILSVFAARVGVELERLRAEEALRASEDRWRTLLENAPDLILSLDRRCRVRFHNQPRLEGLPGPGESLLAALDDPHGELLFRAVDEVFDTGEPVEVGFRARFGRDVARWYSARIGPLHRAETVTAVILVATDVTESKRREAQRELRSEIEQRVTSISTQLLELPAARIPAELDRALAELARGFRADRAALYRADEDGPLAGHRWAEDPERALPRRIDPEGALGRLVERTLEQGELVLTEASWSAPTERLELRLHGIGRLAGVRFEQRGGARGVLLLCSSDGGEAGGIDPELVPLLHIAADLFANAVERERSERERAELEQELQHSQRLEAIGNLAGGIAHDFNNLLTGILGHASLLVEAGAGDERVARAASVIERAAQRASAMTSQLLGFARRREARFEAVDLHATIREAAELLQRTLRPDVELVLDLLPGRGLVWGDGGLLTQVLINLAVNAGDAMPDGGRVEFRTDRVQFRREEALSLPELSPGSYLVLEVTDDGSGMSEGVVDRIFEPFFTTKEAGRGTGMGLSVVYGIVRKHGGAIRCRSAVGIGTSFRLWLPLADEGVDQLAEGDEPTVELPRPAIEAAPRAGRPPRVLIVDDEEVVLATASALLESLGYEVREAPGGREAVELYRAEGTEVDLVLLDLMMPEMNGRECFEALRALDPEVRVVLSSGWGYEGLADEFEALGIVGFAEKPYSREELGLLVRAALEGDEVPAAGRRPDADGSA